MRVETTAVFSHLENSNARFTVEQGGTRSGKTYNILIWLIFSYCRRHFGQGHVISVIRKTFPALRSTAMRDFEDILDAAGIYSPSMHNKSNHEYRLFGNLVEFVAVDQPQKIRGRKRNVAFVNEANELTEEEFFQINIRTTDKIIMDYNPSEEFSWIYEKVIPRPECDFYKTTYLDNPFLPASLIREIEAMRGMDDYHWTVYGLGERGKSPRLVFSFTEEKDLPRDENGVLTCKKLGTGLDWGFTNHPSAVVDVYQQGDDLYFKLRLYERALTNQDISARLPAFHSKADPLWCDSAEPKSIEELRRLGWRAIKADKGQDSVRFGIQLMRRYRLHLLSEDVDLIKEFRNYLYKLDAAGNATDEPVDLFNHAIDAGRYVVMMTLGKGFGKYAVE